VSPTRALNPITHMHISQESPDQSDVIALIADLDAYQDTLYPPEARYALDLASLKKSNVIFVVARDGDGLAVGCGAVVIADAVGELKRMYVRPQNRGQGVARRLLLALEASSSSVGCEALRLETGPYQPEALAFYDKQGYERCGAFAGYADHPLSVFMAKQLAHRKLDA
jgi:putative acetyltransferase